jgi:hypothetical protein
LIDLPNILSEKYYLEDDKKLLDILIHNCHPILSDMITQVDKFNTYNKTFVEKEKTEEATHKNKYTINNEILNE